MRSIFALPGSERQAAELAACLGIELGAIETRRFPDGESYVRVEADVAGHEAILFCTMARPDEQHLRLTFAARTLRELGASRIILVAPYLAYMRQDKRFRPGEAVTSQIVADLLSREFDRLITVDPHLHRHKALSDIYRIPAEALHAAPLLADWIAREAPQPLIVGPDVESEQWVADVAGRAGAPYAVLRKDRRGDRQVEIAFPDLSAWLGRTAVLVDDIAASGRTLTKAAEGLAQRGFPAPVCAVVHPLFAEDAFARLSSVCSRIVSTDAVTHPTNAIPLAPLLAGALQASDGA